MNYFSFTQHKSLEIICNLNVLFKSWFNTRLGFEIPESLVQIHHKPIGGEIFVLDEKEVRSYAISPSCTPPKDLKGFEGGGGGHSCGPHVAWGRSMAKRTRWERVA
jgi:hypothetical protein